MQLPGTQEPLSPVVVQMLPTSSSTEITSSTHTLLANSPGAPDACLSPKHVAPATNMSPVPPVLVTSMPQQHTSVITGMAVLINTCG